jgi:hypothetical protein
MFGQVCEVRSVKFMLYKVGTGNVSLYHVTPGR